MKKVCFFLLVILSCQRSFGALNAYFAYATYDQPGHSAYVETYLNIVGSSVKLKPDAQGKYIGTLEIQWVFKKGDQIVHFDKYNLHSPALDSSTQFSPDFIDQQRVVLDTGKYNIELKISDKNSGDAPYTVHQDIQVSFPSSQVSISDIELLESYTLAKTATTFTKSGYDVLPYILGYYPPEISSLKFYAEIYRTKQFLSDEYLVKYYISNNENRLLQNDLVNYKKQNPADVNVILGEIPITNLASGNYMLTVEVRNKENKLVTYRQVFFQRSNIKQTLADKNESVTLDINNSFVSNISSKDTLKEFIACLAPISSNLDVQIAENQMALGDEQNMKQYILHFWTVKNPKDPEGAWNAYKAEVNKVNASFSTLNKRGYEADRGRVYLQYGPPNSITSDNIDPNAIPYEIWHYYAIQNQSNRKFVFYNPDGVSNDYKLLHSDANGELKDDSWELKLHSRSQQFNDPDKENSIDIYGTKTKDNFKNPK